MERLISIVKEARKNYEGLYAQMVDDYLVKTSEVLKRYLEDPSKVFYKFYSVGIIGVDYSKGTVTVDNCVPYTVSEGFTPYADGRFVKLEEVSDWVLEDKDPEELVPLIKELEKRGFKYIVYSEDFDTLYPFVEIQ